MQLKLGRVRTYSMQLKLGRVPYNITLYNNMYWNSHRKEVIRHTVSYTIVCVLVRVHVHVRVCVSVCVCDNERIPDYQQYGQSKTQFY